VAVGRTLQSQINIELNSKYRRNDLPLNLTASRDDLDYKDISQLLKNGRGADLADLQYHSQRNLINTTETFNLDGGITNIWGDTLDYDAVKQLIIFNRETAANRYLEVTFKNEHYYIGPEGARIILEPAGPGIQAVVSSTSQEEGILTVSSNADITYDLIIIGASAENSSSGA